MEKVKIGTSFNIELEFETPELHRRLFAWLIDVIIILTYYIIVMSLIGKVSLQHKHVDNGMPFIYNLSAVYLLIYLPILLYYLVSEIVMNGQSIGKKLTGIKVIAETGGRPALHQYLIRWLLRPFDFYFFGLVGLLTVVNTKRNQRLGDIAAGTLVIRTRMQTDITDTVFWELNDNYKPKFKEVMSLSDRDMNIIKGVLNSSRKYNNFEVAARTTDKIKKVLNLTEYQEPVEFLETILKDYNYYSNQN